MPSNESVQHMIRSSAKLSMPVRLAAIAGLLVAAFPSAVPADVVEYVTARYVNQTQTSDAAPLAGELWLFSATVTTDADFEALGSTVAFDRPPAVSYELIGAIPIFFYYNSAYYTDEASFLADFPETTYTFTVDVAGAPQTGDVFLPADLYCAEIPALTGDTFTRLQGCDPSVDFDGTINGFTPAPGTTGASTQLYVIRVGDPGLAWQAFLGPDQTTFQIPAGTLLPAENYAIGITYANQTRTAGAGFTNAESVIDFSRGTGASFSTVQNCDHFVDSIPVGLACTEAGQSCGNRMDISADTCGLLQVEYFTSAGHCSPVGMQYFLDGILVATSPPAEPGASTGLIDLGPVSAGAHVLSLEAFGVEGGCNTGFIQSWSGTLRLHRCAVAVTLSGPDPQTVCPGAPSAYTVVASGTGPFTYQWFVQAPSAPDSWSPLTDGPVADVGDVTGSLTETLSLASPVTSGLLFRAEVASTCSTATSDQALLTISGCTACPADFNGDGILNSDDLSDFITGYFNVPADPATDFNADGVINADDLGDFITAYFNGC